MARYADALNAGRSRLVPFKAGEGGRERHARRLHENLIMQARGRQWCEAHGLTLKITNGGHHWQVRGALIADWWPSSAKFVFDKHFDLGVHVHDVEQFIVQLERVTGVIPPTF